MEELPWIQGNIEVTSRTLAWLARFFFNLQVPTLIPSKQEPKHSFSSLNLLKPSNFFGIQNQFVKELSKVLSVSQRQGKPEMNKDLACFGRTQMLLVSQNVNLASISLHGALEPLSPLEHKAATPTCTQMDT